MTNDMPSIQIEYLVEDVDRHGNVRLYVRRKGFKKVRIRAEKGSREFWKQYNAAIQGAEPAPDNAPRGSLNWLCTEYQGSAEFKTLGKGTRTRRPKRLKRFCEAAIGTDGQPTGPKPYRYLLARHIRKWRDINTDKPEATNDVLKALRALFKWAVAADVADFDPAKDVPLLSSKNPDGWHTWTFQEIEQFIKRHPFGTRPYLALCLLLFLGVRRSDFVKLGPQMELNGWISFNEFKNHEHAVKPRDLPILSPLRAAIDACPSGQLCYLPSSRGTPYTKESFGNWFKRQCVAAGLHHCSAHGLRKAGATIAADNGATEHQLMAMYGWESPKQAALYTKRANRKRLAGAGMPLIVSHFIGGDVPPAKKDKDIK